MPFSADPRGVTFWVQASPGAGRTSTVMGEHGDAVRIRVGAPPVDGKANAALVAFLAAVLGVPLRAVELVAGETSRRKRILVRADAGLDVSAVRLRLVAALEG